MRSRPLRSSSLQESPIGSWLFISAIVALLLILTFAEFRGLGQQSAHGAFPGANGKIAFDSFKNGNWDIYVANSDGSDVTRITTDPALDWSPAWSPDGTKIAFSSDRDGTRGIYIIEVEGGAVERLTVHEGDESLPAWSPDGTKIAFVSDRHSVPFSSNDEIYVIDVGGDNETRLTNNAAWDSAPAWSPDGSRIAFHSDRDDPDRLTCVISACNVEIYSMDVDGSDVMRLTNNTLVDTSPAWSPDGTKIVATRGPFNIFTMNSEDGTQEVFFPFTANSPAWSPDGHKIVSTSAGFEPGVAGDIIVSDVTGENPINLTQSPEPDGSPDWQPLPIDPPEPPDDVGFDYPVSEAYRPTRQAGDSDGWSVVNYFGASGIVPTYDASCVHPGDDWNKEGGDVGETVKAVADGRVEAIKDLQSRGYGVVLSHLYQEQTYYSVYLHVTPLPGLVEGQEVSRGDQIATIGSFAGFSPHLHFEMRTQMNPQGDWYPTDIDCDGDGLGDGYYISLASAYDAGFIDPVEFIDANRPGSGPGDCETSPGENAPTEPERGVFVDAHERAGGEAVLGCPTSTVQTNGFLSDCETTGHYQTFDNGAIEYHANGNHVGEAYAIVEPLFTRWVELGLGDKDNTKGDLVNPLGYPTSDLSPVSRSFNGTGTALQFQSFECDGALELHLDGQHAGKVVEIHGGIFEKWGSLGFADSVLGLPVPAPFDTPGNQDEWDALKSPDGTTGRVQQFERGHIRWHANGALAGNAFETHGQIDDCYVDGGGTAGDLGFPIADQGDGDLALFEGGFILRVGLYCSTGTHEELVAERYKPILYFHPDECFYPMDVEDYFDDAALKTPGLIFDEDVQGWDHSGEFLVPDADANQYLDLPGEPGGGNDQQEYCQPYEDTNSPTTAYTRVKSFSGRLVIQYWFFYYFNPFGVSDHEGDWEWVQIVFPADRGLTEIALNESSVPDWVGFSQHFDAQRRTFLSTFRDDSRVRVSVAEGSHANSYAPLSCVEAGDVDSRLPWDQSDLRNTTVKMIEDEPWMDWPGRWGEVGASLIFADGPDTPSDQEPWTDPIGAMGDNSSPCPLGLPYSFSAQSPVELHLYDGQNRHTGSTPGGKIEIGIPGSAYTAPEDSTVKAITLSEGASSGPYRIEVRGTGDGQLTLSARVPTPGASDFAAVYTDIPVSDQMRGRLHVSSTRANNLEVDLDGDGVYEMTFLPEVFVLLGDVDCDADADAFDALGVLRELAELESITPCMDLAGDVDCDGQIDTTDLLKILRLAGAIGFDEKPSCSSMDMTTAADPSTLGEALPPDRQEAEVAVTRAALARSPMPVRRLAEFRPDAYQEVLR